MTEVEARRRPNSALSSQRPEVRAPSAELPPSRKAPVRDSIWIAGAEFHCLPGLGHFGWAEDPQSFNTAVLDLDRKSVV